MRIASHRIAPHRTALPVKNCTIRSAGDSERRCHKKRIVDIEPMPHDSTTDAWLDAPVDHVRRLDGRYAGETSGYAPIVWTILALAICAFAFLVLKGRSVPRPEPAVDPALAAPSVNRPQHLSPAPVANRSAMQEAQRSTRITKCTSPIGAPTTFSDGPCPPGSRRDELLVRPDINLADGMSTEQRISSIHDSQARAQSTSEHERQAAARPSASSRECAQLNAVIASLDATARQPLPGAEQDRIRDQRKRARDRQFALRCS